MGECTFIYWYVLCCTQCWTIWCYNRVQYGAVYLFTLEYTVLYCNELYDAIIEYSTIL